MDQSKKQKSKMVSSATSVLLANLVLLVSGCRIRRVLLLFSFFDTLGTRVGISQGYNQAFIQTDSELRYLVDGGHTHFTTSGSSLSDEDNQSVDDEHGGFEVLKSPIKFEPPELDFNDQPIGLPVLRRVTVYNLNAQSSIQMLSISGNTIHFHCSFFADKVIPPSGNTSFDVVFLGRDEGLVENTLYIHTSAGSFRFNVRATGTPNPYRLKPLIGVKMPLNSSYTPMIQLHNPHPEPIQVLEMYSSGGDLHLELPGGENEGPQTLWQIPPYQTKSVMKANFLARLENNHTAYIRIKTNTTGAEFLYLPLEVEVSSQPGIYCPQEIIDFGLVPTNSPPRTLKLFVLNSGLKAIQIQNVIATPVTEALSVNFRPFKISPDTMRPTVIAEVTLDPSLISEDGIYSGKIVIKSKNSQFKATIPYRAHVLTGRLTVDSEITQFQLKEPEKDGRAIDLKMSRSFSVSNQFKVSVAVHNVSLASEAAKYFKIKKFQGDIISPGKTQDLFVISLTPEAWKKKVLDSWIMLHTNISTMNIPLIIFHGKVDKFFPGSPSQKFLDFGTLGMAEKRDAYFTILNRNPVTLSLKSWGANLTGTLLEMMGVERGAETEIMQRTNFSGMSRVLKIPPSHYMVFRIGIFTPSVEGDTNATVFVSTEYEAFHVPFKFRVAKGSLSTVPSELIFEPAFPGKTVELKLKVYSSFLEEMITDSVSTKPPNDQFSFRHAVQEGRTVIMSSEKSFVGRVIFDPSASCRDDESCYSGFPLDSKMGKDWFQGCVLESGVGEADVALAHGLYDRFRSSIAPSSSFNITLNLDTNKVRGFLFNARAKMVWPRVTRAEEIIFPLTMVGNWSYAEVILINPTDSALYIHLVPFSSYPDSVKTFKTLPSWMKSHFLGNISNINEGQQSFKIMNVQDDSNGTLMGFSDEVESVTGVSLHRQTKAFILAAGHKAKVRLRFQPTNVGKFRHGMYVRNNLTGIEVALFSGESVHGEFKFGKFRHDHHPEEGLIEFDMKEKHLKDCEDRARQKNRFSSPLLTVKRSIRLKNTGLTSIYVNGFEIESLLCEGYGFKILDCEGFDLKPSETREIAIAFSPDFTLSKVTRTLTIDSNIGFGKVNFTLVATVPPHLLAVCGSIIPRPSWEYVLYYSVNIVMIFTLVVVIVSAAVESDRIVRISGFPGRTLIVQRSDQHQKRDGEVFDLRNVGDKLDQEMRERDMSAKSKKPKSAPSRSSEKVNVKVFAMPLWRKALEAIKGLIYSTGNLFRRKSGSIVETEKEKEVVEKTNREEEKDGNHILTSSPCIRRRKQAPPKPTKTAKRNSKPFLSFRNFEEVAEETSSTATEGELDTEPCFETANLATDYCVKSQLNGNNKKKQKTKEKKKNGQSQPQQCKVKKETSKLDQHCKKSSTSPLLSVARVEPESSKKKTASTPISKKATKLSSTVDEEFEPPKVVHNTSSASSTSNHSTPTPPTSPFFNSPSHQSLSSSKTKKVPPVGKILPEVKRPENRFGAVGTKISVGCKADIDSLIDWRSSSLSDARFNHLSASSKMGETPSETQDFVGSQQQLTSQRAPMSGTQGDLVNINSRGFYGGEEDYQGDFRNHREESLMRSLQMERRQRTQAYLQSATATDWPGFDENDGDVLTNNDYIRNLWDSSRSTPGSVPTTQPGWNGPTASLASSTSGGYGVWSGAGSVWSAQDVSGTSNVGLVGQEFGFRTEEDRSVFGLNDPSISSIWSSDVQQLQQPNQLTHQERRRRVDQTNNGHRADAWNSGGYGLQPPVMRRHQ